jgi:hypothetical protein
MLAAGQRYHDGLFVRIRCSRAVQAYLAGSFRCTRLQGLLCCSPTKMQQPSPNQGRLHILQGA